MALICRRLRASVDRIELDIWVSIMPSSSFTAQSVWSNIALPDARLWGDTKLWGYPMNLTFMNATTYKVRPLA